MRDKEKQKMTNLEIDTIKAISIHAPHAYAICLGKKPYEYRNSPTKRRGWVLIHSSSSKASDSCFADYGIDPKIAKRQALIGAAFITACSPDGQDGYAYNLTGRMLFKNPIEGIKGCQSVFWGHSNDPQKFQAFEQAIEQIKAKLN